MEGRREEVEAGLVVCRVDVGKSEGERVYGRCG